MASMAVSSPMAVRTITSADMLADRVSRAEHACALTGVLSLIVEELVDLFTNLAVGELDVVLGGTVVGHEGQEAVISNVKLRLSAQGCWRGGRK